MPKHPHTSDGERRHYPRVVTSIPATFTWGGKTYEGDVCDLGVNGLYAHARVLPEFGERVEVFLPFRSGVLCLVGTVRWVNELNGFGVQFALQGALETHAVTELMRAASTPAGGATKRLRMPVRTG